MCIYVVLHLTRHLHTGAWLTGWSQWIQSTNPKPSRTTRIKTHTDQLVPCLFCFASHCHQALLAAWPLGGVKLEEYFGAKDFAKCALEKCTRMHSSSAFWTIYFIGEIGGSISVPIDSICLSFSYFHAYNLAIYYMIYYPVCLGGLSSVLRKKFWFWLYTVPLMCLHRWEWETSKGSFMWSMKLRDWWKNFPFEVLSLVIGISYINTTGITNAKRIYGIDNLERWTGYNLYLKQCLAIHIIVGHCWSSIPQRHWDQHLCECPTAQEKGVDIWTNAGYLKQMQ